MDPTLKPYLIIYNFRMRFASLLNSQLISLENGPVKNLDISEFILKDATVRVALMIYNLKTT